MPSCQGCPAAILSPLWIAGTPSYPFGLHAQLVQFLLFTGITLFPCYKHVFITPFTCFMHLSTSCSPTDTKQGTIELIHASMHGPLTSQHLHTHTRTYQQAIDFHATSWQIRKWFVHVPCTSPAFSRCPAHLPTCLSA